MSCITLIVPMGDMEWAERMLSECGGPPDMISAMMRTLNFVRSHVAMIVNGPTLFHVGGNIERAVPIKLYDETFAIMDNRFGLLNLLDRDEAATMVQKHYRGWRIRTMLEERVLAAIVVQKHFRGWKARMMTAFNPMTRLGAYYVLREFRAMVIVDCK